MACILLFLNFLVKNGDQNEQHNIRKLISINLVALLRSTPETHNYCFIGFIKLSQKSRRKNRFKTGQLYGSYTEVYLYLYNILLYNQRVPVLYLISLMVANW